MQDCYAGDIGDFGKYGLLRWLCGMFDDDDPLSLGVLWYRVPDEDNNDGGNTSYLHEPQRERYRVSDPHLFERLREMVCSRERSIAYIEKSGVLPERTTCYFGEQLVFPDRSSKDQREQRRAAWLEGGQQAVESAQLIFADPDNGLESNSADRLTKKGMKYTYYTDLAPYWNNGKSIIIYQHQTRDHLPDMVRNKQTELRQALGSNVPNPIVLCWRRVSARVYFIVPAPKQAGLIEKRIGTLLQSDEWGREWLRGKPPHFTRL